MQPEVRAAGGAVRQLVVLRVGAANEDLIPGARDKGERRALRRFFLFGIARLAQIPGRAQLRADIREVALALGTRKLIEHAVEIVKIPARLRDQTGQVLLGRFGLAVGLIERGGVLLRALARVKLDRHVRAALSIVVLHRHGAVALPDAVEIGLDEVGLLPQGLAVGAAQQVRLLDGQLLGRAVAQGAHLMRQLLRAAAHGLRLVAAEIKLVQQLGKRAAAAAFQRPLILQDRHGGKILRPVTVEQHGGRKVVRLDRKHERVQLVLQARALRIVRPLEPGAGIAERAEAHLPAQQGRHTGKQAQQPLIERRRRDRAGEQLRALLRRRVEQDRLVLPQRQAVKQARLHLARLAHGGIHAAHAVDDVPVGADENDVRLAAKHLDDEPLFDRCAEFIAAVEIQHEHTLKVRLRNTRDARADEVLAQEHAEHRRFGRVFKRAGREMHPRAAHAAVHEQLCVAALCAHGQQQQVALRLLHLVDARTGQALRQLLRQSVQKNCVHWHVTAPPRSMQTARAAAACGRADTASQRVPLAPWRRDTARCPRAAAPSSPLRCGRAYRPRAPHP